MTCALIYDAAVWRYSIHHWLGAKRTERNHRRGLRIRQELASTPLHNHPLTKAEELQTFLPIVEGRLFLEHQPNRSVNHGVGMGSDGIMKMRGLDIWAAPYVAQYNGGRPYRPFNNVKFDSQPCGSDNNYVIISSLSGFALFIQSYRWD